MCLLACKNKTELSELPISEENLVEILADLHLYENKFESKTFLRDSLSTNLDRGYDSILQEHGVTHQEFFKTYNEYLVAYPLELDSLYNDVAEHLEIERDSIRIERKNKNKIEQPVFRDSVISTSGR